MDFFPGFKWAIPKAFSDAISNCRFEEGDIIYDSEFAYNEWKDSLLKTNYYVKIKYPKRTTRSLIPENSSVQKANWNSTIRFELMNFHEKKKKIIETTQGALFSVLWKGDFSYLDFDNSNIKPALLPFFLKNLIVKGEKGKSMLEEAIPKCRELASGKTFFIIPYDPTNDVSLKKHQDLREALSKGPNFKIIHLPPKESGLKSWEQVFPVITINLFIFEKSTYEEIEHVIKDTFYKPTANSRKQAFNLDRHGILQKGTQL